MLVKFFSTGTVQCTADSGVKYVDAGNSLSQKEQNEVDNQIVLSSNESANYFFQTTANSI